MTTKPTYTNSASDQQRAKDELAIALRNVAATQGRNGNAFLFYKLETRNGKLVTCEITPGHLHVEVVPQAKAA
jgi:hypothetical protein